MAATQKKLLNAIKAGNEDLSLHLLTRDTFLSEEMAEIILSQDYQLQYPALSNLLSQLAVAIRDIKQVSNQLISSLNTKQKNKELELAIKNGRRSEALALMANGAELSRKSAELVISDNYKNNCPRTYQALQPYTKVFFAKGNYIAGLGGFRADNFSHVDEDTIYKIQQNNKNNSVINTAFRLVKALDKSHKKDMKMLSLFLKKLNNTLSVDRIKEAMLKDEEKIIALSSQYPNLIVENQEIHKILVSMKTLQHSRKFLNDYPNLAKGYLPRDLDKFTNIELTYIKTILLYAAKINGIPKERLTELNSFYKLKPPAGFRELTLASDNIFYLPTSGYVLYGDQHVADKKGDRVALTDCSGFMTNVMRELRPDVEWLKHNRFRSWDMEKAHDIKMERREGMSESEKGPLNRQNKRRRLHSAEINRYKAWYASSISNRNYFDTVDTCFDTVKNASDIKPGDFVIYRQRINGAHTSSETGHVAMIADYDKATNKSVLLEYTRSGAFAGFGFTRRNICYGPGGGVVWESRILRPKGYKHVNQFNMRLDEPVENNIINQSVIDIENDIISLPDSRVEEAIGENNNGFAYSEERRERNASQLRFFSPNIEYMPLQRDEMDPSINSLRQNRNYPFNEGQHKLELAIFDGKQISALKLIATQNTFLSKEIQSLINNASYQNNNPATVAILREMVQSIDNLKNNRSYQFDGDVDAAQAKFKNCLNKRQQNGVLFCLASGAKITPELYDEFKNAKRERNRNGGAAHPKLIHALEPFILAYEQVNVDPNAYQKSFSETGAQCKIN